MLSLKQMVEMVCLDFKYYCQKACFSLYIDFFSLHTKCASFFCENPSGWLIYISSNRSPFNELMFRAPTSCFILNKPCHFSFFNLYRKRWTLRLILFGYLRITNKTFWNSSRIEIFYLLVIQLGLNLTTPYIKIS